MIQNYDAVEGQSLLDVCLNTYGSLDLLLKLIMDNGVEGIADDPTTGDNYSFDSDLISESTSNQLSIISSKYATKPFAASQLPSYFLETDDGQFILTDTPDYISI
jgi:hypothetical protein